MQSDPRVCISRAMTTLHCTIQRVIKQVFMHTLSIKSMIYYRFSTPAALLWISLWRSKGFSVLKSDFSMT